MNSDIRLSVGILDHVKTHRIISEAGPAALMALLRLWFYAAQNHPDGKLGRLSDDEFRWITRWMDVELFGETSTPPRKLFIEAGWIDAPEGPDGPLSLHDWKQHQPWVADAEKRSASARRAAQARWGQQVNAPRNADAMRRSMPLSSPSLSFPKKEKGRKRPAGPPPGFVRFWETYPTRNGRKCGKAEALKAWKEVRCEPHAAEIVARLEDQIRHKKACDQNGKFVAEFPDAFRWIKKRRFNDEIQEIDA